MIELWNCTGEEYHADPSLSQSKIKAYLKSPEQYHEEHVLGESYRDGPEPRHFQYGHDFERLLFYGETPGKIIPNEVLSRTELASGKVSYAKRGPEWKEFESRMQEAHGPNVRLLKQEEWDKDVAPLLIARDKIRAHQAAKKLVFGQGLPHLAFRWTDEVTGLPCKCQLDMIHGTRTDPKIIVDVKSARDASVDGFEQAIGNFGYHIQAYWYRLAVSMWCGQELPFVFVVSQSTPPYTCETFDLDPEWYRIAEVEVQDALRRIANQDWHSETHGQIVTLRPKPWDRRKL